MKRAAGAAVAVFLLAGCASSGSSKPEVMYGTPAAQLARNLGICTHPERVDATSVRCRYPDGGILAVNSIAGPADQKQEIPAAKATDFCELVAHGFGVTGLSYGEMKAHVNVNALVGKYGARLAGSGC